MESDNRMIRKRFKCAKCDCKLSKLVQVNVSLSSCDNCNGIMREISESEYLQKTRDQVNNSYRLVFDESNKNQYHNRFDSNDIIKNNLNGDTKKKFKRENNSSSKINNSNNQQSNNSHKNESSTNNSNINKNPFNNNIYDSDRNNLNNNNNFYSENTRNENNQRDREHRQSQSSNTFTDMFSNFFDSKLNIFSSSSNNQRNRQQDFVSNLFSGFGADFPFSESPFMGRINRHNINEDIFDSGFQNFGSSFNNFFRDNFSSNFRSNFISSDSFLNIFNTIRSSNVNPKTNNATSKESLKNLKIFKMNDKYCKKNDKNQIEVPNCCICLSDISKGEETVLLPCGHMFHCSCTMPWLKKNNTCPVCRFELPAEKND